MARLGQEQGYLTSIGAPSCGGGILLDWSRRRTKLPVPLDPTYNCIAYALGNLNHFWYDANVKGYYGPPGEPSAEYLEGWLSVFAIHGI